MKIDSSRFNGNILKYTFEKKETLGLIRDTALTLPSLLPDNSATLKPSIKTNALLDYIRPPLCPLHKRH